MTTTTSIQETLQEYENQLTDVNALLLSSPNDTSLVSLQSDLLELIHITKQQQEQEESTAATSATAAVNMISKNDDHHINHSTSSVAATVISNIFDRELQVAVGTSIGRHDEDNNNVTTTTTT